MRFFPAIDPAFRLHTGWGLFVNAVPLFLPVLSLLLSRGWEDVLSTTVVGLVFAVLLHVQFLWVPFALTVEGSRLHVQHLLGALFRATRRGVYLHDAPWAAPPALLAAIERRAKGTYLDSFPKDFAWVGLLGPEAFAKLQAWSELEPTPPEAGPFR